MGEVSFMHKGFKVYAMLRRVGIGLVVALMSSSMPVETTAREHRASSQSHHISTHHKGRSNYQKKSKSSAQATVKRDSHGRIKRSASARNAFKKTHPCPSTGKTTGPCPGYVIDHIKALKHGGADSPSNMQWQTESEAKAKDKWE
jgi:hypothetical protein